MARQRSHEHRGRDRAASNVAALVRLGRIAREGLGRAANDNHARGWSRVAGVALVAAVLAIFGYAVLRWIV